MADDRTPRTLAENPSTGAGVGTPAPPAQEQQPDASSQRAPAGPLPTEGELPSVAVPGGSPMQLGGYAPDGGQPPLVSTDDDPRGLGVTSPPAGIRR